jgi:hypothetical protein
MAIFNCQRNNNKKSETSIITVEYRNKYSDNKRHLFLVSDEGEIRLCDNLASKVCTLPTGRHSEGKQCKKCESMLEHLKSIGSIIVKGYRTIFVAEYKIL